MLSTSTSSSGMLLPHPVRTVRPAAAVRMQPRTAFSPALMHQPRVWQLLAAKIDGADLEDDAAPVISEQTSWVEEQLRELDEDVERAPPPVFSLSFLWLDKNIAVAADQVLGNTAQRSPVTEYYFWPKKDAWEELKTALEARPWISERDKVLLLNKATEVINFWQDEANKNDIEQARSKFPECVFMGN